MKHRSLIAGIAAAMALAGSFASASAATLKVTVEPTVLHRNETYLITISGWHAPNRTPHLLAFIQYTGQVCRATATAEYQLPVHEWNWVFWPQRTVTRAEFKQLFYERARTRYGERRVCAYLYAQTVTPQTTAAPIVRAGVPYREVR